MAVVWIAAESHKVQQDTLWGQCLWTQPGGRFTIHVGRAPARLPSRNPLSAVKEAARSCTFLHDPARLTSGHHHERLSGRRLLLLQQAKPEEQCLPPETVSVQAWVAQPVALEVEMGRAPSESNWSWPDDAGPHRPVEYESGVTADVVSKLCQKGRHAQAVEALGILVQRDCCILQSMFYDVLKTCVVKKDLVRSRRVHAFTVKMGYQSDTFLCNHILRMYVSHSRLLESMDVFAAVAEPDIFLWTSIISAHVKHGQYKQAIQLYHLMRRSKTKPDGHVFVAAIQACARGSDLTTGMELHAHVLASGVEPDLFIASCLVDMYAKCGSLQDAQRVFDDLGQKNVVTWNAIIAGYSQHGMGQQALHLYSAMQEDDMATPDSVTFKCLLQACASLGKNYLERGKELHEQIKERGHENDMFVASSLVNMYAKCGGLEDARRVFDGLCHKDVVVWNAMIGGYSQQGMGQEALRLFSAMQEVGAAVPNSVTILSLLQACASVGTSALEKGKQLHLQIKEDGKEADVLLANSLVNMYAKCGSLEDAQTVFNGLEQKDVVTWNALIAGYSQQGMSEEALRLHTAMQEEAMTVPDSVTFVCLLQACASVGPRALEKGKQLHTQITERGLHTDVPTANSLMNMYAKCGCLEYSERVFGILAQKDVVTWNSLIAAYSDQGMCQKALCLYSSMQEDGKSVPNSVTFVCLLQACARLGTTALEQGKQLHFDIREQGYEAESNVANSLVNMYAKCGSLKDAQRVFDGLQQRDVVTWTALIAGYSQQGMGQEALGLYSEMQGENIIVADSVTIVCLLQACTRIGTPALETGRQLYVLSRERGHLTDAFVGSSLINMFAKCGSLKDAQKVFDRLVQKDTVAWNAIIAGYSQQGMGQEALSLYRAMQEEGMAAPDSVTFVCILQACASLGAPAFEMGKLLHRTIREQGLQTYDFVSSSLVSMYAKCGSVDDAQTVFKRLHEKDVVTWNAMIAGYAQYGKGQEALRLYSTMQEEGLTVANAVTFVCLLQACASVGTPALEIGRDVHRQIIERGHLADDFVASSLVHMYSKCGSFKGAQRVFDGLSHKDVATWNAMIAGCSQHGMGQEALHLFRIMQEEGIVVPNSSTFVCLLQACASVGGSALGTGRLLHAQIKELGVDTDVLVANSLVHMYAKCGGLQAAHRAFNRLGQKDVVTWNIMIAGYCHEGMVQEAFLLYSAMHKDETVVADSVTYVSLLQACANMAALHVGRQLHAQLEEEGLQVDTFVAGSLINMYGRSGSMDDAQQVFDALPEKDIVVWSALIAGYTCRGDSESVFHLFQRMQEDGIQPDGISFLSVLTACSHAGLLNKGILYFEAMSRQYDITPTVEHYSCMVDLLGRAGQLGAALAMVRIMPLQPNSAVWHTLLGACRKWSNVAVGCIALNEAVNLDNTDAAAYVLMSNIYTTARMWEQAQEMQAKRKKISAYKQPGQCWWTDMDGQVHNFLVGVKSYD